MTYKVKRRNASKEWSKKYGPGSTGSYVKSKKPVKIKKTGGGGNYGRKFETNADAERFDKKYKKKYDANERRNKRTRQRAAIRRASAKGRFISKQEQLGRSERRAGTGM